MKNFHYWLTRRYDASAWVRLAVLLSAVILSNLLIWPVMAMVDSDVLKVILNLTIIFGISAYLSVACTSRPDAVLTTTVIIDSKVDSAEVARVLTENMHCGGHLKC